jgi:hypothetical protein
MTTQFTKDTAAKRASAMLATIIGAAKPYLSELQDENLKAHRFDEIAGEVNEEVCLGLETVGECLVCLIGEWNEERMLEVLYLHSVEDIES